MNTKSKNLPVKERCKVTVEAVIELAGTLNLGGITTAAITKHMNLTQGAPIRHFSTKEEIWLAVMPWRTEQLLARTNQSAQGIACPIEAMQAMFIDHVDFVAEHPSVPRMLMEKLQRVSITPAKRLVQTMIQHYEARLHRLLEVGITSGVLPTTLNNKAAAMLFIGIIQRLVIQSLITGDMDRMRDDAPRVFAVYSREIESLR